MHQTAKILLKLIIVPLALVAAAPLAAQQIGVVASVDPAMNGRPPGAGAVTKSIGSPVVSDEVITTSGSGRGQILFRDQTTLTVSPNTEIVLDGFVFDASGSGKSGLSLTRGALRFIGGKNSRTQEATIRTPTAIIGVRGSSALISHANGLTEAILIAGDRLCLGAIGGNSSCTNRQGGIMTEAGYAGQADPAQLASAIARIDGTPQATARFQPQPATNDGEQAGEGRGAGLAGIRGIAQGGPSGGTGIAGVTDTRSAPVSSRGELRDFQVFDDNVRSDAIVGISTGRTDPIPETRAENLTQTPMATPPALSEVLPTPQPSPAVPPMVPPAPSVMEPFPPIMEPEQPVVVVPPPPPPPPVVDDIPDPDDGMGDDGGVVIIINPL